MPYMTARARFTHKTMTEQVEFLEHFIVKHTSSIIRTKPLQEKVMSSVRESSLVESNHIPSIGSTHESPPEPRTSKETMLHPSEFHIEFKDFGNTLKLLRHEKLTHPPEEVSPKMEPSKEWLMEVKHSYKTI